MALSERSRSALYLGFSEIVDEEAIQEMLSYFPARDVEEPVTKEFLRAEIGQVRVEFANLRSQFADLRGDFAELRGDFANLRSDFAEYQNVVDSRISQLDLRLASELRRFMWMNIGALTAFAGVIIAAAKL